MRFLFFFLCSVLPLSCWALDAPETKITISAEQYQTMLGDTDYKLADKVTMNVSPDIIGSTPNASVQVSWGTCIL